MVNDSNENEVVQLSEYEISRAKNIERNNAKLRTLGLISVFEERRSNAVAWGRNVPSVTKPLAKRSCKKRALKIQTNKEAIRKSRRLSGKEPERMENSQEQELEVDESEQVDDEEEMAARVEECRRARLRVAKEVSEAGADKAAKENPTATYDHCLMRVRTMTDKALANRVKAIERAAGRHCVVKMAIFKCCLQEEGKWDLSELASSALERLKALQPPPE